jgi:NitT/TauT family transport system permease protein
MSDAVEPSVSVAKPVEAPAGSSPQGARTRLARAGTAALSLIVFLCGWEALIRLGGISSYLVPAPSAVLVALGQDLITASYWTSVGITLYEILLGFVCGSILGVGLGIGLALSPTMDRIIYPYVVAIQTIPKVAIAPLMIVWFGFGIESKVLIVALTSMFPVLVNTIAGLRATDSDRLDLLRGLCASPRQTLVYVQFPNALPYIFAGLNTAIVLAVIGAIVGEFVGARSGLGVIILKANFGLDLASVFSSLIVLGVIGVLLNGTMRIIERRVCFWANRRRR